MSNMGITINTDVQGQGLGQGSETGQGLGPGLGSEAGSNKHTAGLNKAVVHALHRNLPDFQLFLNLRVKYTKVVMESMSSPMSSSSTSTMAVSVSNDGSHQDVTVDATSTKKAKVGGGSGGAKKGSKGASEGNGGNGGTSESATEGSGGTSESATEGSGGTSGGGGGTSGGTSGGGGGTTEGITLAAEKARYLLGVVLRIVEIYVKIAPELVAQTGNLMTRHVTT